MIRLSGFVGIELASSSFRPITSANVQVAFARLVLERNRGTGREQLAEAVWPDGPPNTWTSALRSIVSRVRTYLNELDTPGLETTLACQGGRYVLTFPDDVVVDIESAERSISDAMAKMKDGRNAEAFQSCEDVAAKLQGSFLPTHDGEWVNSVRQQVDSLRLSALEVASLTAAALGRTHRALQYANEAIRQSPFRESAHRCRITAHAIMGNRAEALSAYHELRLLLAEELGIDPAPEVQAAYLDLLQACDDSLRAAPTLGVHGSILSSSQQAVLGQLAPPHLSRRA
ncbi:BTAD domain-containing putative transcriptional regulator [Lipingzhangella sp. LS1_29]|uniref:BTAD domain-containing putative transcriptional regulator n=1 Tax=Lipingzhangella rawalii TaxID=2055835 RepID=A0ABU2HB14_9ACTN|nr:BTAD domain-containing putative transcriptional regulator [Lipingzhangella rawalii]MDS1272473.1 BTAD domain-containing putative transcriptional regulator [Lipingzhangella rawalii]